MEQAHTYAAAQDWEAAAHEYANAAAIEPSAPLFVQIGHMLKEAGYLHAAVRSYRAAIYWDGTGTDARLHLGHLLKRLGKLDQALAIFKRLSELPHAPYVASEITGLEVAKLNGYQTPTALKKRRQQMPKLPGELLKAEQRIRACISGESARRTKLSQSRFSSLYSAHKVRGCIRFRSAIPASIKPVANLIIKNNSLFATTNNPQMMLEFLPPSKLAEMEGAWIEFTVRIEAAGKLIKPVIYIESQPGWQRFSTIHLSPTGNGSFRATFQLSPRTFSIRFDPLESFGPFQVSELSLKRLSLTSVLCRAYRVPEGLNFLKRIFTLGTGGRIVPRTLPTMIEQPALNEYDRWIAGHDLAKQQTVVANAAPTICSFGWLLPLGEADIAMVLSTIQSLKAQVGNIDWKLSILASSKISHDILHALHREESLDHRITVDVVPGNADRGTCLNYGANTLKTKFIGHIEPGDRFSNDMLLTFAGYLSKHKSTVLLYCDHDFLDKNGRRHSPRFKPDWNTDYAYCYDYIGRTVVFSDNAFKEAGKYSSQFPGREDFDLVLRVTGTFSDDKIIHVPLPLWHCVGTDEVSDIVGPVTANIRNRGLRLVVQSGTGVGTARLVWPLPKTPPHVTVIIPTRDRIDLLRSAIDSILTKTTYPNFDITVVDNGSVEKGSFLYFNDISQTSRVSILRDEGAFNFSRLNNRAAAVATGSVLAFINNDIEVIEAGWLSELVSTALDPHVGAVGAKLLYRSGHVQHAGIVGGVGAVAGHGHKNSAFDDPGYMNRLIVQQSTTAVTAACLVVEKRKFDSVCGFDELNLAVAFNDVDLCLKLGQLGWRTIFTPWAVLQHHESISRGPDVGGENAERFRREALFITEKWGATLLEDRFYNPNLTREYEDFSLGPGNRSLIRTVINENL